MAKQTIDLKGEEFSFKLDTKFLKPEFSISIKVGFNKIFSKYFLIPRVFTKRFYHELVDLHPTEWIINDSHSIFGGLLNIDFRVILFYQATLEYLNETYKNHFVRDMNYDIQRRFSGLIKQAVIGELSRIEKEGIQLDEIAQIKYSITKEIENRLFENHILSQSNCDLNFSFSAINAASDEELQLNALLYRRLYEEFKNRDNEFRLSLRNKEYQDRQEMIHMEQQAQLRERKLELEFEKEKQRLEEEKGKLGKKFADFEFEFEFENTEFKNGAKSYLRDQIKMPVQMRTAFKQYLIFFNDFVKIAKGRDVSLEIHSGEEGLELLLGVESFAQIDEINRYLTEYLDFVRQNIDSLNVIFESKPTQAQANILILDLRNQIRNLQSSLENRTLENKMLRERIDDYQANLRIALHNPIPVTMQISQNTNISSEFNIDHGLPILRSTLSNFREALAGSSSELVRDLEKIDHELSETSSSSDSKEVRNTLNKLHQLLIKVGDEKSEVSNLLKGVKKGIALAQQVCSIYNKFAEYLGLPIVPKLFLDEKGKSS